MAQPGDVIVCDAGVVVTNWLFGELMLTHAIVRGVAGLVINWAVRYRDAFLERNLPVYAVGVTPRGPYKDGPGEICFAISLAGMVIQPGDLVLGDMDGVLAVPRASAAQVLERARAKSEAGERPMASTLRGETDRTRVG